jgi:hypothetical protein
MAHNYEADPIYRLILDYLTNSPTQKQLREDYHKANENIKEFANEYYVKKLEELKKDTEMFPSPEYLGYSDLEVGKIYHIASGLSHTSFKVHEKIMTDKQIYLYVYTIVKTPDMRSDIPDSFFTEKHDSESFGQIFSRYKEGVWKLNATPIHS